MWLDVGRLCYCVGVGRKREHSLAGALLSGRWRRLTSGTRERRRLLRFCGCCCCNLLCSTSCG